MYSDDFLEIIVGEKIKKLYIFLSFSSRSSYKQVIKNFAFLFILKR